MKIKALGLSIVLCVSLALTGCGGSIGNEEPAVETLTGILTEQLPGDDVLGTHLLTDDEGVSTPLRSLAINLSGQKYLENKVQVIGFIDEDSVFEVTGISVIEVLSEASAETMLVSYKNTDFGIQLKYYNDWDLDESNDTIIFAAPKAENENSSDDVKISQFAFAYTANDMGENDTLSVFMSERHPEVDNYDMSKIGVDAMSAVKVENDEMTDYYVYRSGFVYRISFEPSENFKASNKMIFNEMVSEFQFTGFTVSDGSLEDAGLENANPENVDEPIPTPVIDMEFTSFESLLLHFSAKYPSNWYYAGTKGTAENVIHHYAFSDESVTDDNELISLDVISGNIPNGEKLNLSNGSGMKVYESGGVSIYVTVDGQNYKVSGSRDYEDITLIMADSITPIEAASE
ncbi:MAG: hypothetical protein ABIH78_03355 [Candidatus Peregrinibacteria bacterium]